MIYLKGIDKVANFFKMIIFSLSIATFLPYTNKNKPYSKYQKKINKNEGLLYSTLSQKVHQ